MKYIYHIYILFAFLLVAGCSAPADSEQRTASTDTFEPEAHPDDDVRTLRLYVADHDLEYLYDRDPKHDNRINGEAKLDMGDEILSIEGVRFRGNSTRLREKKPFSIEFTEPQDFLHGSDRLNLNAMYTDPSMLREQLAFDMFRILDIPSPKTEYYRLYINDVYEGLYTRVERIDRSFLSNIGLNPNGTLVRDQMRNNKSTLKTSVDSTFAYDLSQHADNKAEILEHLYDYRGKPNWLALGEFQEWVYKTEAGTFFEDGLFEFVEKDNFMDFLAVHFIIGDMDSFGNDYWMYLDHENPEARWIFIPWDKDLVLGSGFRSGTGGRITNDYFSYENPISATWDNVLVQKVLDSENLRTDLENRIHHLIENEFNLSAMNERIADYQSIVDGEMATELSDTAFTLHGQNFFGNVDEYGNRKETVSEFFKLRYEFLPRHFENPSADDSYSAEAEGITEGEGVYMTNADGYVMARIQPEQVTGDPVMRLSIEQNSEIEGINRTYNFETEGGSVTGEITLYYRNNTGWLSRGNWIMNGSDFKALYNLTAIRGGTALDTTINPYTNKAVFDDTLEGDASYTIEFME